MTETELKARIRDIPDFPKPGIVFKDITPLLADAAALRATLSLRISKWRFGPEVFPVSPTVAIWSPWWTTSPGSARLSRRCAYTVA